MSEIPQGLCHCGCGKPTRIASKTDTSRGIRKGDPQPFLKGHHTRLLERPPRYIVDAATDCWVWQGFIRPDGYGRHRFDGRNGPASLAHRWYYEQHVGLIPDGLVLDHLCRNRACVNPAHLEPVTLRENILRGEGKGARYARRTHCDHGHELSGDNLGMKRKGDKLVRMCLACRLARRKAAA